MTVVKICGLTNVDDALASVESGADMLGFNFYHKSPRCISPGNARKIICEMKGSTRAVGIFVNESVDQVLKTAETTGVDTIQLHGDEDADYVRDLRKYCDLSIIKAFRLQSGQELDRIFDYDLDAILLDAHTPGSYGGTGAPSDWELAQGIAAIFPRPLLAGGLTTKNVRQAIRSVCPYGVDTASGVEIAPGRKDPQEVRDFIRIAKES